MVTESLKLVPRGPKYTRRPEISDPSGMLLYTPDSISISSASAPAGISALAPDSGSLTVPPWAACTDWDALTVKSSATVAVVNDHTPDHGPFSSTELRPSTRQ